jgi:hypothetical protein
MLSDYARSFFEVEICNERKGGVSPATLGSAIERAGQAPEDVMADWLGVTAKRPARKAVAELLVELRGLQAEFGNRFRLQELLEMADQEPIRFTCPKCGRHELEEIQTDVIVISRVVGRIKGEWLFMYGNREYGADKAAPYYRCAACKELVADDDNQMHEILDRANARGGPLP